MTSSSVFRINDTPISITVMSPVSIQNPKTKQVYQAVKVHCFIRDKQLAERLRDSLNDISGFSFHDPSQEQPARMMLSPGQALIESFRDPGGAVHFEFTMEEYDPSKPAPGNVIAKLIVEQVIAEKRLEALISLLVEKGLLQEADLQARIEALAPTREVIDQLVSEYVEQTRPEHSSS